MFQVQNTWTLQFLIKAKWDHLQKIIKTKWNYLQKIIKGPALLSMARDKNVCAKHLIKFESC